MQLQIFEYREDDYFGQIGTVEIDGEIWFVASDVCKVLEITNTSQAVSMLDEDEKLPYVLDRAGQKRSVNIISESGLYVLIFKSRKPSAKRFKKWVTKEVIPSIRKKGYYGKIDRNVLPDFAQRYVANCHNIPNDHFSVITELFTRLYMQLERVGYVIPNEAIDGKTIMPDISVGRGFAAYLKLHQSEFYNSHKKYTHTFPDGRVKDANMYHIKALPVFINYINLKTTDKN